MPELKPWLPLIFRRKGRLTVGAGLLLGTLLSGIGLLALSGWFLTETALVGLLLAAGIQAYINLYVPGGGIRFFAVSRTVFRYLERVYNHNTVLQLLTDIRVALFDRLAARPRGPRAGHGRDLSLASREPLSTHQKLISQPPGRSLGRPSW